MPWPSSYVQVQVAGSFKDAFNLPIGDAITFEPSHVLYDEYGNNIIPPAIRGIDLVNGWFQVYLLATDEPHVTPKNWWYNVSPSVPGMKSFKLYVPSSYAGSVLDISTPLASELLPDPPLDPSGPTYATLEALQGEQAARIAADALLVEKAQLGAPNGVAELDGSGLLVMDQFPVDEFLSADSLGEPNGVAQLGGDGVVLASQLPAPVVHSQMTPSALWTINYTYGARPDVDVYNNNGDIVVADVKHPDDQTVTIGFTFPETGKAILRW